VAGISPVSPKHSLEPAWYRRIGRSTNRIASSTFRVPIAMLSIVSTGWSKDSPTEVCPAR
jgi:hypothetical protein